MHEEGMCFFIREKNRREMAWHWWTKKQQQKKPEDVPPNSVIFPLLLIRLLSPPWQRRRLHTYSSSSTCFATTPDSPNRKEENKLRFLSTLNSRQGDKWQDLFFHSLEEEEEEEGPPPARFPNGEAEKMSSLSAGLLNLRKRELLLKLMERKRRRARLKVLHFFIYDTTANWTLHALPFRVFSTFATAYQNK